MEGGLSKDAAIVDPVGDVSVGVAALTWYTMAVCVFPRPLALPFLVKRRALRAPQGPGHGPSVLLRLGGAAMPLAAGKAPAGIAVGTGQARWSPANGINSHAVGTAF